MKQTKYENGKKKTKCKTFKLKLTWRMRAMFVVVRNAIFPERSVRWSTNDKRGDFLLLFCFFFFSLKNCSTYEVHSSLDLERNRSENAYEENRIHCKHPTDSSVGKFQHNCCCYCCLVCCNKIVFVHQLEETQNMVERNVSSIRRCDMKIDSGTDVFQCQC